MSWKHPWVSMLLAVALLASGCASTAASHGFEGALTDGFQSDASMGLWNPEEGGDEASQGTSSSGWRGASAAPAVPPGWPHLPTSEEVLGPFLETASPAGFVALQRGVDMPRLVEGLKDWDAVRLGALGPVRKEAAEVLNRKRAAFVVMATEKYGVARAEVFALFLLHTAFDEDVRQVLRLLARDKQLGQTLGQMGSVREELQRRGLSLSRFADREEQSGDVARGLGRAARDALGSSPLSEGARYQDFSSKVVQLPAPYQEAMLEVEKELMRQHFEPGSVVLGGFDHLTFGVPVGFYHLVVGTGQGASSLARGRYEQATRELAPSALLVALYAGGRSARSATATTGRGTQVPALSLQGLKAVAERLEGRLGGDGLRELARYLQGSREWALLVCEGGEAAAVALHEARGNVGRAQAWLMEAKPPRAGAGAVSSAGGVAGWVREAAGFTREAGDARLRQAELEAPGARLSGDVAALEARRPSVDAPPRGAVGQPLWREYVAYWEGRVAELKQGKEVKAPLTWEGYQPMRAWFARGLGFERDMVARLRTDAELPRGQRRWLQDFNAPRIETHVGVAKEGAPGVRYVDVLVIEESPPVGQPPRVETFSFKSRDLSTMNEKELRARMVADASDALNYYGEALDLRRRSLRPDGKRVRVEVQRVRLIYEGGSLKPGDSVRLGRAVNSVRNTVRGVEVSVQ